MKSVDDVFKYYESKIPTYEYMRAFTPPYNTGRTAHDMSAILHIMKGMQQCQDILGDQCIQNSYERVSELEIKIGLRKDG